MIRDEIEREISLPKHTSQTYVLSAYNKESLLRVLPIVAGMKGKLDKGLKQLQGIGIFEVVTEVLFFFGLDGMLQYDGALGYFLLALESDPEELQPILDGWIEKLSDEEKEWAAETVLVWYIHENFSDNQTESMGYCFEGIWQKIPSRKRERLIIKFNKLLDEAPDEMVCFAWELMSGGEVFMSLSDDIKRRYINSYFLFKDEMFRKPDLLNMIVGELQQYGMGMLDEKNHKDASKVFLNFYLEFGGLTDEELTANELEGVHLIPGLLYNSNPEFLGCFREQLQRFVSSRMKSPDERNKIALLNDLIDAINNRADLEAGKKWGMIEVFKKIN
ncbi:hypothetical protein [Cognataquiflexum rubidum]|uniref:hypothetical protein n=1 Tax=Cognataquiflexum rubidum TaxID=2922273 RepID=UPI001F13D73E|nr:hypothetical protein [Cognataquiflexum rubidum]MCH6236767.1 hypothetical protein [Cognataquiflexum rubidum]